jgi:1-deoxy-D-xylulose-5-phosphate reductoisomerase
MARSLTILGATGSVGRSTAEVVLTHRDELRVEAVVGGRDAEALAAMARRLGARFAALADERGGMHLDQARHVVPIVAVAVERDRVLDAAGLLHLRRGKPLQVAATLLG